MKPGHQQITQPRIGNQKNRQTGWEVEWRQNAKGAHTRGQKKGKSVRDGPDMEADPRLRNIRDGLKEWQDLINGLKSTSFCSSRYSKVSVREDHSAFWLAPNSTHRVTSIPFSCCGVSHWPGLCLTLARGSLFPFVSSAVITVED